ncbi:MAG TPA: FxLYD domain-containing protein [Nitrososphaeraceae archaeon]|nr:FxLYD domain-containing protein [Nitrososphaeraceae archaeon]
MTKARQSGVPLGTVSILSNSSYADPRGILHIVGEVYNDMAPNTAKNVQVIATFYDSSGKVVGTNSSFTNPKDIASGEKAPFDLSLASVSIPLDEIDHYNLQVDWK